MKPKSRSFNAISDAFVAELEADGLDAVAIGRDPARTMGLYLIALTGAERSFHYYRDTSAAHGLASDAGTDRQCLPSFDDEAEVWGDATPATTIARFAFADVAEIAVKDGPHPVSVWLDGQIRGLPTPEVQANRDTNGAGDAFNAGCLSARLLGQTPGMAVTAGQRFAAGVIRHVGARLQKAF